MDESNIISLYPRGVGNTFSTDRLPKRFFHQPIGADADRDTPEPGPRYDAVLATIAARAPSPCTFQITELSEFVQMVRLCAGQDEVCTVVSILLQ
jgi:hypothetical protein